MGILQVLWCQAEEGGGLEAFDGKEWSEWEDPATGDQIDDFEVDTAGLLA